MSDTPPDTDQLPATDPAAHPATDPAADPATDPVAGVRGGYRQALAVREFQVVSAARLVSILGDSAAYLAVTVLVFQRTGSALLASTTFAISFVPYLFGGTLLAALTDRLPPRRLIVGTDLLAGGLVLLLAWPGAPIALIFLILFAVGTMAPVRGGCIDSLVVVLLPADSYVAGRSVQRIIAQGAQLVGIAAGGALIAPLGPRGALLADVGSFVLSAVIVRAGLAHRPCAPSEGRRGVVSDSLAGVRRVWAEPAVRRLLLLGWTVPFVAVAPEALAAPAVSGLGRTAGWVGLWLAAIPVGMIVGDLVVVLVLPRRLQLRLTWPLALALPAVLAAFWLEPGFWPAMALLLASGATSAYGLGVDRMLRDVTPETLRGRTFALNGTGLMVCQGTGFVAAGAVGEVLRPGPAVGLIAAVGLVAVLLLPLPDVPPASDSHG
ncbi:MFS transporter [Jatrophihabitans telluris]|uniref:MFS transporter n=1 Tax=Jatrophihabitans telluris TaxID=2038343 RepID=A0ABY4QYH0_9ACTN|nr:MFS transporter [Jatrophihabitans telluris]UQX88624.1 MFS transporter [Jatrophihabitans telluris]